MKVNYIYVSGDYQGKPILQLKSSGIDGLKKEFNPKTLSKIYPLTFIDIYIEDEKSKINENNEALQLVNLLDLPLDIIEEIITDQRPRADDYSDFFLILFKFLSIEENHLQTTESLKEIMILKEEEKIEYQVGIIVRDNLIISLHKDIPITSTQIYNRFNKHPMKIAKGGITFFISAFLDMMIDKIYVILRSWTNEINNYEQKILEKPKKALLDDILDLKHRLLDLVKILQADREIINNLRFSNPTIFKTEDIPPELDDHVRHLLDETDIIRNLLTELTTMYYNSGSARLNETMKRFTFITSLLLLPSLIAGIFGMNNYLGNFVDFWVVLVLMVISVVVVYVYFKFRKLI